MRQACATSVSTRSTMVEMNNGPRSQTKVSHGEPCRRQFRLHLPSRLGGNSCLSRFLLFDTPESLTVPFQLHRHGLAGYEPETIATFLTILHLNRPDIVYDIGANIGLFSLLGAALSESAIVAFEPDPTLIEIARHLVEINGLTGIEFEQLGLSDAEGRFPFYLSSKGDSSNSLIEGFRTARETIQVTTRTLDSYRDRQTPGLIKLDVESAEPLVLAGGRRLFEECRPWLICELLGPKTDQAITAFFSDLGYHWFQITSENPLVPRREIFGDRGGAFRNWMFAPTEPSPEFWKCRAGAMERLRRCTAEGVRASQTEILLPGPVLDGVSGPSWAPTWNKIEASENFEVRPMPGRRISVSKRSDSGRRYLSHGRTGFDEPPEDADKWSLDPSSLYELEWEVSDLCGSLEVRVIVIQYSQSLRLGTAWSGESGETKIRILTDSDTRSMRLAIRIQELGDATIGPFNLSRFD
ncbi:hypothetical protein BH23ACT5_BH23ACT5_01780 [soil metagenome]